MKVFISQPMKDKTVGEILKTRLRAIRKIKSKYGEQVEILDQIRDGKDKPENVNTLWYLGESLKVLSKADVAYFCKDWEKYRGCKIEYECALAYQIETVILSYED